MLESCIFETKLIQKLEKCLHNITFPEDILDTFPSGMRQYVTPLGENKELLIKKWESKKSFEYFRGNIKPTFKTLRGEFVRSKSEVMIADRLFTKSIPYKYEFPLQISERLLHPDFTVLNKRTMNEYIWEHFGMMDNPEYCENALIKLKEFAANGYILGKNLICTFESSSNPILTEHIEKLIDSFLV